MRNKFECVSNFFYLRTAKLIKFAITPLENIKYFAHDSPLGAIASNTTT